MRSFETACLFRRSLQEDFSWCSPNASDVTLVLVFLPVSNELFQFGVHMNKKSNAFFKRSALHALLKTFGPVYFGLASLHIPTRIFMRKHIPQKFIQIIFPRSTYCSNESVHKLFDTVEEKLSHYHFLRQFCLSSYGALIGP